MMADKTMFSYSNHPNEGADLVRQDLDQRGFPDFKVAVSLRFETS